MLKSSVERVLRRFPSAVPARVLDRFGTLSANPLPRGAIMLSGAERLYRLRVGDNRVVYEVDADKRRITVYYVRHRSTATATFATRLRGYRKQVRRE